MAAAGALGACCCWNLSAELTAGKMSRFLAASNMVFAAVLVCGVDLGSTAVSTSTFGWRLLIVEALLKLGICGTRRQAAQANPIG